MGTLIAAIIILALIFYALKDLLSDRDFSAWTNMALTSLILFTVILSIFMILNKSENKAKGEAQPVKQEEAQGQPEGQVPAATMSDGDIMLAIAEEYILVEEDYKKSFPGDPKHEEIATNFIINKYGFTPEEWQSFLSDAAENDLFAQARAKIAQKNAAPVSNDVDYLIKQ